MLFFRDLHLFKQCMARKVRLAPVTLGREHIGSAVRMPYCGACVFEDCWIEGCVQGKAPCCLVFTSQGGYCRGKAAAGISRWEYPYPNFARGKFVPKLAERVLKELFQASPTHRWTLWQ